MIPALATAAALICTSPGAIDGDTLRCASGEHVRLWGVNTPERYEAAGPPATRALARLVTGQEVRCVRKGKSYNRIVGQCFIGTMDLSAEMVRQGWAVDVPRYSGGIYREFEW